MNPEAVSLSAKPVTVLYLCLVGDLSAPDYEPDEQAAESDERGDYSPQLGSHAVILPVSQKGRAASAEPERADGASMRRARLVQLLHRPALAGLAGW